MRDLIVSAVSAVPPAQPDWFARGLAALGLVVTLVLFIISQRGKAWRGRRDELPSLTEPIDELRSALEAVQQNSTNAYQLWTERKSLALTTLRDAVNDFPDSKMRRLVAAFRAEFSSTRGDVAIRVEPDQDPPSLSAAQRKALIATSFALERIDKRIRTIRRKGSVG